MDRGLKRQGEIRTANYETRIRQEWNRRFLEVHITSGEVITEYVYQMLKNNKSSQVLEFFREKMNGQSYLSYDITDMESLESLLKRDSISEQVLKNLLRKLIKGLEYMEEHLIPLEYLLLQKEYIYMSGDGEQISFCILPFPSGSIRDKFQGLAEYLLTKTDHREKEGVKLVYEIYRESAKEVLSLDQIKSLVYTPCKEETPLPLTEEESFGQEEREELLKKKEPFSLQEEERQRNPLLFLAVSAIVCVAAAYLLQYTALAAYLSPENMAVSFACLWGILNAYSFFRERKRKKKEKSQVYNFQEKEADKREEKEYREDEKKLPKGGLGKEVKENQIFDAWEEILDRQSDSKETVFLAKEIKERQSHLLLLTKESEEIPAFFSLQEEHILVGKTEDVTRLYLQKEVVSRLHAQMKKRGDDWWIQDMGSKNGTYINEEKLAVGEEKKLADKDRVTFADISYEFHHPRLAKN